MNPDIWSAAIGQFYALAEEGTVITAVAGIGADGEWFNASGQVEAYREDLPHVMGLRGVLNRPVSGNPNTFHELELVIAKPIHFPPENAELSVTDTVANRSLETSQAFAALNPLYYRLPVPTVTGWITYGSAEGYMDVWLTADPSRIYISQAVEGVLATLGGGR